MATTFLRSNRVFLVGLLILLALAAAFLVTGLMGGSETAGAASHAPVVQITPEDAHWYDVVALVDNATGDRLHVAYNGHPRDGDCCLHTKTSEDGGNTWSEPMFIGDGHQPDLGRAVDGTLWLVYQRWNEKRSDDIYYRTSTDDGASWSEESRVPGVDEGFNERDPAVVVTLSGRVIVAWQADTNEGPMIRYSWTDDGGGFWEGSFTPDPGPYKVFDANQPDLAVSPSGDTWLIYRANVEGPEGNLGWALWYQVSDDGNNWSPLARLQDGHHRHSIAGTTDGLVLAWQQGRWDDELQFHNEDVYYRTSDADGATWSAPVRYTMYDERDDHVKVAGLSGGSGGFGLVWRSQRQHIGVEYTQRDAFWFGNPDMHEDVDYPPAVVRLDHFPVPNARAGAEAYVEATIIGDVASAHVEWSIDGVDQADVPMSSGDGGAMYKGSLGIMPDAGARVEYLVRVEDPAANIMRSHDRGFEVVAPPQKRYDVLMVVDDRDRWQVNHIAPYYKRALEAARISYDFWDTSHLGAPLEDDLSPYLDGAVIWSVPDYNPWLWNYPDDENRIPNAITAFLNEGGSLFMSGHQIAEHFRNRESTWLSDHLRVERANCCASGEVGPTPGSIFGGLPDFTIRGGSGANNSHSPDALRPVGGARSLLEYVFPGFPVSPGDPGPRDERDKIGPQGHDDPARGAATGFRQGQSRVVFFGFNFESIPTVKGRARVIGRVMHWINPTCGGRASTIDGHHGPDVINGTPGDDVIVGLGGEDEIFGWDGDDVICGGPDDDIIDGGDGNDWIASFEGDDTLRGRRGNDVLRSGPGNDLLRGGGGWDLLVAGPGNDWASGGGGNDRIKGNDGADRLWGKSGHDLILGGAGNDRINCGPGKDIARGGRGRDRANKSCEVTTGIP